MVLPILAIPVVGVGGKGLEALGGIVGDEDAEDCVEGGTGLLSMRRARGPVGGRLAFVASLIRALSTFGGR